MGSDAIEAIGSQPHTGPRGLARNDPVRLPVGQDVESCRESSFGTGEIDVGTAGRRDEMLEHAFPKRLVHGRVQDDQFQPFGSQQVLEVVLRSHHQNVPSVAQEYIVDELFPTLSPDDHDRTLCHGLGLVVVDEQPI